MKRLIVIPFILILFIIAPAWSQVKTGLDVLIATKFEAIRGLRVGVITNQTAVSAGGTHIVDVLRSAPDVQLKAIFGPEHGVSGKNEAGDAIESSDEDSTAIPVYSLYGVTRTPTAAMFENLDALIFDIQDVGTRFYTYISTMNNTMEAAAAYGKKYIVLDRPNPVNVVMVEGPVLSPEHKSFVGIQPIALRHGMTVGELATMFNEEGWLKAGKKVDLTVVKMQGWERPMFFEETGLSWIPPSPNMPTTETALIYCGIGLIEATNLSEGRGTKAPFKQFGAPWLDAQLLIDELQKQDISGVRLRAVKFTPVDIPGMATNNKYDKQQCNGIQISVMDAQKFHSVALGLQVLTLLQKHYAEKFELKPKWLNKLTGQGGIAEAIRSGEAAKTIMGRWNDDLQKFSQKRANYLLYQ